jgi:signal transduction histidine kinase/ligand-binding sensor domain-containing protein/AraC-like DNA-binding protein
MKIKRTIFVLILLTLCYLKLNAQEYLIDIQEISIKDGLPNREIFDVLQDNNGLIWVSTRGAISSYDGYNFKTYDHFYLKTLDLSAISIACDENNYIWYSSKNPKYISSGVIDPQKDTIYDIATITKGVIKSNEIANINYSQTNKDIWFIITIHGDVYKYDKGLVKVFELPTKETVYISFFDIDSNGTKWLIYNEVVIREDKNLNRKTFKLPIKTSFSPYFNKVFQFDQSTLFKLGPPRKISYWELKDEQFIPYEPLTSTNNRINLIANNSEVLIILNEQELYALNKKGEKLWTYQDFKNKTTNPLFLSRRTYLDKQKLFWVGSSNGLFKINYKKNPFTTLQKGNSIRGIYQDANNLYTGGYTKNIKENLKTGAQEIFIPRSKAIMAGFCKDEEGNLWIGNDLPRLYKYIPQKDSLINYKNPELINQHIPFINKKTGRLWVGSDSGLLYFDREKETYHSYDLSISSKGLHIRQFHESKDGIWIVSNNGLFLMESETETIRQYYTKSDGFPVQNFLHLYEDSQGYFWFGTKGGGLIKWDRKKNNYKQYKQSNGLSNNTIYAVYEDENDQLWLPSDFGLNCFNKTTLTNQVYLPQNGIAHEEFNRFAHYRSADGTIYFGGLNGITKFHPKDFLQEATDSIPLYLTNIEVLPEFGSDFVNKTNEFISANAITLLPNDKILNLEFSLLDYQQPENTQYAYQIEGFQNNWLYLKKNNLSFANLPYGHYTLNIKAKGISSYWTEQLLSIPLIIKKPFYLQWWFIISTVLTILSGLFAYIKGRTLLLEKEKEKLEIEVKKRTWKIEQDRQIILSQTEELKQLDKMKTRFITNITHEFRTPLTLVISPLEQLVKEKKKQISSERLNNVLRNAKSILDLIDQLLDLSKLGAKKMEIETSRNNIIAYTNEIINSFKSISNKKNIRLIYMPQPSLWETWFDHDKWNKIINNLLWNAIKFTPTGGAIQICLTKIQEEGADWIFLTVKDTGIGIKQEQLNQIFNRFYQVDNSPTKSYQGTGIGLSLVKELIEVQKGEIIVKSKLNKGTTFEIKLPVLKDYSTNTNPKVETVPIQKIEEGSPQTSIKSNGKFKILLIEDNLEMLDYIQYCIKNFKHYIYTAIDGKEGIEKALKIIPDLIISDIMMPKKDGFEVVKEIRNNLITSHIPIILLSARTAIEDRIKGLERGADAYLTKPFSAEELNVRILKLIEIRQLLQKKHQETKNQDINLTTPFTKEEKFISSLKKHIIKNITDEGLNGDKIGEQFKMSRMQLHRKIKALSGQSTSDFIQTIRLEYAFNALQEGNKSVKEVAFESGFATANHFSRVFKRKYGKSPSEI